MRTSAWSLALVLRDVVRRYDALWGFRLPYVLAVHQAPVGEHPHGTPAFSTWSCTRRSAPRGSSSTSPVRRSAVGR